MLQETKWTQAQLQHLAHTWPDIRIAAATAKVDPNPQGGVAILLPPGWTLSEQKLLVDHYAIAASVSFQACQVWLVSVYLPPSSPQALANKIFQAILSLEEYPVFIAGDFNRCDQHHPLLWDEFLSQAGLLDADPTLPTYWFSHQQGHVVESPLDRVLVPSIFLDTAQLHIRITGRYRIHTCHRKLLCVSLRMKPRLTPHPSFWIPQLLPLEPLKRTGNVLFTSYGGGSCWLLKIALSLPRSPCTLVQLSGAGGEQRPKSSNNCPLSRSCICCWVEIRQYSMLGLTICGTYRNKVVLLPSHNPGHNNIRNSLYQPL